MLQLITDPEKNTSVTLNHAGPHYLSYQQPYLLEMKLNWSSMLSGKRQISDRMRISWGQSDFWIWTRLVFAYYLCGPSMASNNSIQSSEQRIWLISVLEPQSLMYKVFLACDIEWDESRRREVSQSNTWTGKDILFQLFCHLYWVLVGCGLNKNSTTVGPSLDASTWLCLN